MDKVVAVLGESIEHDQYEILKRYIRFRLRRPFALVLLTLESEAKNTFKKIQESAAVLIIFVVEPYQNVLVTEQYSRFQADPQFDSVDVITLYVEQLARVDCSKDADYVEQRLEEE